ncbi:serine hydrolase domain-containing protein [Lacticaseibacillus absianus]|uniref:serine hydrolase domain-containing protein n=1 Tax=Lacticaseibacillus absianus TaxID=2729623 RepID=UPI0015CA89C6|nr:serine hydrolase domain-containing protein [Lacticaseibacillus absianus]
MRRAKHRRPRWLADLVVVALAVGLFAGGWWLGRMTAPQPAPIRPVRPDSTTSSQATAPSAQAATTFDATAQRDLGAQLAALKVSGTALIIRHGRVIAQYVHGLANAATGRPNTVTTMYEIDSMQKSLTAGLFMRQVNAGQVALTTPLAQFFPRFKTSPQITMAHLLHMTSGLRTKGVLTPRYTTDAALVQANVAKLINEPAVRGHYQYTPINYLLLAGIGEQLTGQTYAQSFQTVYVEGLKLAHTRFAYALRADDPAAVGYTTTAYTDPQRVSDSRLHAELGTGQVFMSALDFYHAARALLSGQLLGRGRDALYDAKANYSGGFFMRKGFVQTNGTGYGFFSTARFTPDGQNAIVLLSNVQAKNRATVNNTVGRLFTQYALK